MKYKKIEYYKAIFLWYFGRIIIPSFKGDWNKGQIIGKILTSITYVSFLLCLSILSNTPYLGILAHILVCICCVNDDMAKIRLGTFENIEVLSLNKKLYKSVYKDILYKMEIEKKEERYEFISDLFNFMDKYEYKKFSGKYKSKDKLNIIFEKVKDTKASSLDITIDKDNYIILNDSNEFRRVEICEIEDIRKYLD